MRAIGGEGRRHSGGGGGGGGGREGGRKRRRRMRNMPTPNNKDSERERERERERKRERKTSGLARRRYWWTSNALVGSTVDSRWCVTPSASSLVTWPCDRTGVTVVLTSSRGVGAHKEENDALAEAISRPL